MKRYLYLLTIMCVSLSCDDKVIDTGDVLTNLTISQQEIHADGQSTVEVTVELDKNASSDRRSVVFSTSSGTFLPKDSVKATVKAEFFDGKLIATTKLRAPVRPGTITVTAKPEYDIPSQDFILEGSLTATLSVPAQIRLNPSGFAITANFGSQVALTATLRNSDGKFVSAGYKVVFEDLLGAGGPAGGRFNHLKDVTTDSSVTAASYSAPKLPIGTDIMIKATVLDNAGAKTGITDSVILTINQ